MSTAIRRRLAALEREAKPAAFTGLWASDKEAMARYNSMSREDAVGLIRGVLAQFDDYTPDEQLRAAERLNAASRPMKPVTPAEMRNELVEELQDRWGWTEASDR